MPSDLASTAYDDQLRAELAEARAWLAANQWRQARVSRAITNALCAVDELTGPPFQKLLAEVRAIAAELPGVFPQLNAPAERTRE